MAVTTRTLSCTGVFAMLLLLTDSSRATESSAAQPTTRPACESSRLRDIKPCLQSFIDDSTVVGLVTLVDRAGLPVQLDAVGQYRPESIFQIASLSKPFIAAAIMILIERGKIPSVDSRVSDLPGFRDFPHRDTTIKQLLTHTAGVWYKREDGPDVWLGVEPFFTNRMDKAPAITVRDKSLAVVAEHYANAKLYPLGATDFHYSNIGYLMLGWVVERLGGRPLDRFMTAEVFDKVGMKDTFYFPALASAGQRERIIDLDRRKPDPSDYIHYEKTRPGWMYVSPGGGMYSTARDLHAFLRVVRNRGEIKDRPRLLRAASIEMLTSDQMPGLDFGCAGRMGRGLGFVVVRPAGCASTPAYGAGTVFHRGRFSTEFWYSRTRDEIGISLYQRVESEDTPFPPRRALQQLVSRITAY